MPAILLALFSKISLKDWLWTGAVVSLLIGFGLFVRHERAIGASHEVAAVEATSKKVQAAADAKVAQLTVQHAQDTQKVETQYETQLQAASALHDSDAAKLKRLLNGQANSGGSNSVLHGPSGGQQANVPVPVSSPGSSDLTGELGSASLVFSKTVRDLDASLSACEAERNSLTGK